MFSPNLTLVCLTFSLGESLRVNRLRRPTSSQSQSRLFRVWCPPPLAWCSICTIHASYYLNIDLQGQFPTSIHGYKYVLAIVDCHSRYGWKYFLKTKDSANDEIIAPDDLYFLLTRIFMLQSRFKIWLVVDSCSCKYHFQFRSRMSFQCQWRWPLHYL